MVAHRDKQVGVVQHLVVFEVVQQSVGHSAHGGGQKHGRAFHPCGRADEYGFQKTGQVHGVGLELGVQQRTPVFPGAHKQENHAANEQRKPAAIEQLEHIGAPKHQVHCKEETGSSQAQPQRVFPAVAHHIKGQNSGDQHVGAHRNAIGCGQVARRLEHHHGQHNGSKQAPVDKGNVDLPRLAHAGVDQVQARQVAQLNHLLGHAKGPGDQRLRCNHRRHGGQHHQRQERPVGRHHVKRVFDRSRIAQQERALAKVVQGQARHHHAEPGQADRLFAEMAQVGVQGLGAGHAQHHGAQQNKGHAGVVPHKGQRVIRVQGHQNMRIAGNMKHAHHRNHRKPQQRNRAKKLADASGAAFLHQEQAKQNHQRNRHHVFHELGRNDLQPLHRTQHRNRRGDNAIAIKQAGAKNTHIEQHPAQLGPVFDGLRRQRQHGNQPALALVVGAQHQHHVFERHDDGQRPKNHGQDAVHIVWRKRHVARAKHLFERIQHAGANVAIHHTDGA